MFQGNFRAEIQGAFRFWTVIFFHGNVQGECLKGTVLDGCPDYKLKVPHIHTDKQILIACIDYYKNY